MGLSFVFLMLAAAGAWFLLDLSRRGRAAAPPAATTALPITPAQVDAFLAPHEARLAATRRPTLRIELADFPEDTLTASKLGGRAWWPAAEPLPVNAEGQPLVLLAQLDFAEMPALEGYPSKGLLQFFISADDLFGARFDGGDVETERTEQRGFRVAYWPDTSAPSLPVAASASDRDYLPHESSRPRRMRFHRSDEPMSMADHRFGSLLGGNVHDAAAAHAGRHGLSADDLLGAVYERLSGQGHKVGGYPAFAQDDPRTGGDLELLLQIDSDDAAGVMWGDVGVGNFFIAPADLARADFRRVLYTWDCY